MRTEVVQQLGHRAEPWDELVAAMPLPTPFLRSWWLDHAAAGEPAIVLVFDGAELAGGAAFERSRRAGLEWVEVLGGGPLEPDHLDVVARDGAAADVAAAVRHWLGRPGHRVVDLQGVVSDGLLATGVPGVGTTTSVGVAPYAPLPGSFADYVAGRPGKLRSTITRTAKRLERDGVTVRQRPADEVDAALEALRELHDDRWAERSGFMSGWDRFAQAARAGSQRGDVRFWELVDASGEVVATEVDLLAGRRLCFYQAGRRTTHELRGSGSVLRARLIDAAIDEGCTEYDLLRGDEPYKAEWATERRDLARVRHGVGWRGIAVVLAAEANRRRRLRRDRG